MSLISCLDGYAPSVVLVVGAILLLCWQRLSVRVGPEEPPLLKPKLPYIGHILGLIKYQSAYYDRLYAEHPMPICTLPMINAKSYVITSPSLIQSAFRSKNLSFDPFVKMFAQRMLGLSDQTMKPVLAPATADKPDLLTKFTKDLHGAMVNEHLHKMNAEALKDVASSINEIGMTFEIKSLYLWLRTMMTLATSNSLFGSYNPLKSDPTLVDSLWDFEGKIMSFILGIFPSYLAAKGYEARGALQSALAKYYIARHDLEPSVARMTKVRAAVLRGYGVSDTDIGKFELALLHVSTANAIPTLFWTLLFIASSPSLTASIRKELMSIVTIQKSQQSGKREISVNISRFSSHCPLFVSSYQESTRLASSQAATRRVMADTVISDGKSSYLLKEGADVMMPAGVSHMSSANWGPDSAEFNARRFLLPEEKIQKSEDEKAKDKMQKRAFFPFGGGKHLCPGRNFAFAEILGTVAVLMLGFDVTGTDGELLKVPRIGRGNMAEGVAKPTGEGFEMGAKLTRRKEWEDVLWKFTTDLDQSAVSG